MRDETNQCVESIQEAELYMYGHVFHLHLSEHDVRLITKLIDKKEKEIFFQQFSSNERHNILTAPPQTVRKWAKEKNLSIQICENGKIPVHLHNDYITEKLIETYLRRSVQIYLEQEKLNPNLELS